MRRMKILMVGESDQHIQRISKIYVGSASPASGSMTYRYDLRLAKDARTALELFKKIHPDLVLIDLAIGKDESKALCESVRKREGTRHTGVIFLSFDGHEMDDVISVECLEIGADDVIKSSTSDREIMARTNAVLKLKAMTDELRSANHRLHQLSYTDELTGLNNMRAFNGKYSKAVKRCLDGESGLGVIMMDLDNFKSVNDNTNHLMGSHVISEVGKLIRGSGILSKGDCAARFGGDEYVIFTLDPDVAEVKRKGDEIRDLVRKGIFIKDGHSIRITTSIGVAWTIPGYKGKAEDPIKAADMMLYASKHEGRNRVSFMTLSSPNDLDDLNAGASEEPNEDSEDEDLARIYQI